MERGLGQWLSQVWKDANYDMSIIGHAEAWDIGNFANPNYYFRYDNAECVAVIAQPEFVAAIDAVRDVLPKLKHLLVTGDQYETALAEASPERPVRRSSPH